MHVHETLRLAGFSRSAHALHRHFHTQHLSTAGAGLGFVDADAPERGVDEARVAGDAVGDAPRAMSTLSVPMSKPNSAPRCAWRIARALATSAFVGTQRTFTQVPPKWWRSITTVRSPSLLQRAASADPA